MKIAFHVNQLDHRGSSVTAYDYALALERLLGHEAVIVSSRPRSTHPMEKFKRFKTALYEDVSELPTIVEREKIDILYMAKYGNDDGLTPKNCRSFVHCVFQMLQPHGDMYAGVSEYLALKYNQPLYVPHIVEMPPLQATLRAELGIPKDAMVIGRLGGFEQFNIPFAQEAVKHALHLRKDLYFVFLNTKPFLTHERIRHLPFHPDEEGIYKRTFINSCDAMLHARIDGETFGLAVGEFSAMNRPVVTFDTQEPWYDKAHLHILKDKALIYRDGKELLKLLLNLDRRFIQARKWDAHSEAFSPTSVMRIFDHVVIHGRANAELPRAA